MSIKFVDLPTQYSNANMAAIMADIKDIVDTCGFVGGSYVSTFEENAAKYFNVHQTIGVGSGTDALILALKAAGIGPGDKVLVPANTFIATAMAVTHVGATPVFVDVDPKTYVMTAETAEKGITDSSVKAIMPVHLYGNVVDMTSILDLAYKYDNLHVIEDCAQAFGATYINQPVGTFGIAGCYSFYPAKNLGGLAQGGLVVTKEDTIADEVRCMGNVGRTEGSWFEYSRLGYNSRLDPINASFLNNNLGYIDSWNKNRVALAELYSELLSDLDDVQLPTVTENGTHIYHLYELKCPDKENRDALKEHLTNADIGTGLHYPVPCHKQPIYEDLVQVTDLSVSEDLADTLLSLPMHPFLNFDDIKVVCGAIVDFFK